MNTDHVPHRCPGCGCADDEAPSDDCWLCQSGGELRAGASVEETADRLVGPA